MKPLLGSKFVDAGVCLLFQLPIITFMLIYWLINVYLEECNWLWIVQSLMNKFLLYVVSDSHLSFNTLLDACPSIDGISWIGWKECYLSTSCLESWYCPGWHALWLCAHHVRSFTLHPWYDSCKKAPNLFHSPTPSFSLDVVHYNI
jgi:hypothetical protein